MRNSFLADWPQSIKQNIKQNINVWRSAHFQRRAQVDYRERISVVTWLIVFGLGVSLLIQVPSWEFTFSALGSPVSIPLTGVILASTFLAILAAAGTESIVSVHPALAPPHRTQGQTWPYWALPMALTMIAAFVLPEAPSRLIQVMALFLSGTFFALALFCLYATVEPGRAGFRRARLILDALAYGSALLLFLFVYQARTRSLLSGTLIAATAILLTVELLRSATDRVSIVYSYGAIVGLVLGQVTWAINYWLLPDLTGGLLLLLIFYLLTGIAQQSLQDRLTKRVVIEFAIFAVVSLLLIALVGPGFR